MQRVAILYDASQAVLSTFDLDEVLNRILEIVRDYFHLQSGSIMLLDESTQHLTVRAHFGDSVLPGDVAIPIGEGLAGSAAKAGHPIYSPDVTLDPRYLGKSSSTRSELAIPLMVRDEVVGVLDCHSDRADYFDNETVDVLTLFATQASIGLQNAKLYSMLQRRAAQLEAINALAKRATVEIDLKELLDRLCTQLPHSFPVDHVSIFLRDKDGNLVLRAQQRNTSKALKLGDVMPEGHTFTVEGDGCEEVSLPLVSFGEDLGLLICVTTPSNAFLPNDTQALESVADILATATQNARYVDHVRRLALSDGLLGVFNRRYFESHLVEKIIHATKHGGGVSVLMIDLDHFKKINDDFGHMVGDDVLCAVSTILRHHLQKVAAVCRYGGEEFAVVLPVTEEGRAAAVAEELRHAIASAQFSGVDYPVTVSIGVAEFPANGTTRNEIVGAADTALYQAKQGGRNRVCLAPQLSAVKQNEGDGKSAATTGVQHVWGAERTAKMRDLIRQLYSVVAALELEFEGRKFTPDGHLVGSIGEVVAAYAFGLRLLPASTEGHDAVAEDGTLVQIKLTGGTRGVSLYGQPDHLIVLQLTADKEFKTVYNGRGLAAWDACGGEQKNGQRSVSLSALKKLPVKQDEKLEQVRDFPSLADTVTAEESSAATL